MSDNKYTQSANYSLIGNNKKPETKVEYEKIPEIRNAIIDILTKDREFWDNCKQKQQGVEKFNLLSKVADKIKMNSNVFYLALDELEAEQVVIPEVKDSRVRYSLFSVARLSNLAEL